MLAGNRRTVRPADMRVSRQAVKVKCDACGGPTGRFDGPSPAAGGSWMVCCRNCAGPYGLRYSPATMRLVYPGEAGYADGRVSGRGPQAHPTPAE